MEKRRRTEKNRLELLIKQINSNIDRDNNTIDRLKDNNVDSNYLSVQIEKTKDKNNERTKEICDLEQRLADLEYGKLDKELQKQAESLHNEMKIHKESLKQKKIAKKEAKVKQKAISQDYWDSTLKQIRYERAQKREQDREFRYFMKTCDKLPEYIRKNIKEMPNNKGYIFRGIYFYGVLPIDKKDDPVVLFEKPNRDVLRIHEFKDISEDEREIAIYEKKGKKGRRALVSKKRVKKYLKMNTDNLLDYIK